MLRRLASGTRHGSHAHTGALVALFGALLLMGLALLATTTDRARSATPNPLTVKAVADSYVQSDAPSTNNGTKTTVRADGSPDVRAYLSFDVQGLSAPVTSAVLRVRTYSTSHKTGYSVSPVPSSPAWGETTITYANAPAFGAAVGSSGPWAASGVWTEVNVTSLVSGNGLVSFALTTSSTTALSLSSRESGSASAPQLVITTGGTGGDVTPPAAPTGLSATADGQNAIDLSWTPPADADVVGYGIYRDGGSSLLASTASPSFEDTGLAAGSTHSYRVDAVDGAGNRSPKSASKSATTQSPSSGELPLRVAFYYPWFPKAWNQGGTTHYSRYHPTLGDYSSGDPAVIDEHIRAMQYGNFDAGIASWWGPAHHTDTRITGLLTGADGTGFKWGIYDEVEGNSNPSVATIRSNLTYIRDKYATSPNFLRVDGRFVIFVYKGSGDGCDMIKRWEEANTAAIGAYLVMHVFSSYQSCSAQPDGWHLYGPAQAVRAEAGKYYNISPGFWKLGESPRLVRDLTRWRKNIRDMIASKAPWQIVTSFSEWGEGTPVENATEWDSPSGYGDYLDALHENGATP
jgi:glycosyl hydrolase family 99/fibronectin type III domain protein